MEDTHVKTIMEIMISGALSVQTMLETRRGYGPYLECIPLRCVYLIMDFTPLQPSRSYP